MKIVSKMAALALLAAGAATSANAVPVVSVNANTSGWAASYGVINNSSLTSGNLANTCACINTTTLFRNFFTFLVPAGHYSSAVINIWNSEPNFANDASAVYNLYAPSGYSYAGLLGTTSFGSVDLATANAGPSRYISISLNAAGVSYLNGLAGSNATLSGVTSVTSPTPNTIAQFGGYTNGTPVATLDLVAAVPEPATWGMMILGFGVVGGALRRRKAAVRVAYA